MILRDCFDEERLVSNQRECFEGKEFGNSTERVMEPSVAVTSNFEPLISHTAAFVAKLGFPRPI